ncbi:uncharacterized protein BT62DRAFT_945640 [Guyanagaster necrorhizus]|uniref:Glutamyl-tRNA(Gln) amidotransferase subunit C, mitochondrial n=1 Tax=Guyanagaster necrorhizus TaxID=856835 RepID=A0A9P8AVC0_9AGAR|nr:uncharacterized protein BT62DRAFT_945640 [Guyanagaster necrorhizus MCA 3950]KAG7449404.1 hypothetical protein BT62DRAFT_945640 [Guyanagaster necrorhizus MCA 3950]
MLRLGLQPIRHYSCRPRRWKSTATRTETDEFGIPLKPTWSVNELLSSYPTPTISPATLIHLHDLAALIPPEEGSKKFDKVKGELEELVRLVEAVKLVDTKGVDLDAATERMDNRQLNAPPLDASGRSLLKHAARTVDGFYVVDADKRH